MSWPPDRYKDHPWIRSFTDEHVYSVHKELYDRKEFKKFKGVWLDMTKQVQPPPELKKHPPQKHMIDNIPDNMPSSLEAALKSMKFNKLAEAVDDPKYVITQGL